MLHAPLALLAGLFAMSVIIATPEGFDQTGVRDDGPPTTLSVAGLR